MFTRQTFWLSTLRHFARSSFAVIIGVALATAVICGALIVGDSVRGSLETLSLERLGGVDQVVRGPRFFRQDLAAELAEAWQDEIGTVAPAILVTGSVQTGQIKSATSRRAGHVEVYGVDAAFWKLAGVDPPGAGLGISRRLAEQLELKVGDKASVIVEIPATIPRDALLGERDETVVELPTQVSRIFSDQEMPGRFGLNPSQQLPLNAFVDLEELQTQLNLQHVPASARRKEPEKPARINALLLGKSRVAFRSAKERAFAERKTTNLARDEAAALIAKLNGSNIPTESSPHPGGMPDISRWLSAATPPVKSPLSRALHPGGMPEDFAADERERLPKSPKTSDIWRHTAVAIPAAIPPGWSVPGDSSIGGVAALNHRLMAMTPPGSVMWKQFAVGAVSLEEQLANAPELASRLTTELHRKLTMQDLSLRLVPNEAHRYLSLESERMLIDDGTIAAAEKVAKNRGWATSPVLVSLLTEIENPKDASKFSMYPISGGVGEAAAGAFEALEFASGSAPKSVDEIAINDWLAEDLAVSVGDSVTLKYKVVGDTGELPELTRSAKICGIVKLAGAGADPGLTPYVAGISDAEDPTKWREPFPLRKDRITQRDRDFWKPFRTTPKVFWHLAAAEELFKSRYGNHTSLRIAPPAGVSLDDFAKTFETAWLASLDSSVTGLAVEPVKLRGLVAARGTTDFTGLFMGFSLFLIASALLLVSLLFRLGLEGRSREFGVLMGVGWTSQSVGRQVLTQGVALAAIGGLLGIIGGVVYAGVMIYGLTTWWSGAVGTRALFLHVKAGSLITGWLIAVVISTLMIWRTSRQLRAMSPRALLSNAGLDQPVTLGQGGSRRPWVTWTATGISGVLLVTGVLGLVPSSEAFAGFSMRTFAFFVGGLSALVASLTGFARWLAADRTVAVRGRGMRALATLAIRNAARNHSRSLLTASLIASATFLVVAVASGKRNPAVEAPRRDSGNGGYTLVAETNQPVLYDLNTPSGRTKAGVNLRSKVENEALLNQMQFTAFRMKPGENASCLNLYQTQLPTLLGVPQSVIDQFSKDRRFKFADTRVSDPWGLLSATESGGEIPVLGDMNTLQYSLHKGIGSTLEVEDANRRKQSLKVRGMLDGSVFQGVLLMSEENLLRLFPDTAGYRYFLIEVDPAIASQVTTLLETDLADAGFDAERVADRLANFLSVQNTYLSTFQTLGGLGLLLGTVGLGVVMMRNVWERRSELALLRAVGYTTSMLRQIVLLENAFLLTFGLLAGSLAAAVAMAPHLLSIGADVSWPGLGLTILAVFAAGMLSSLAAVREVERLPMLMALRVE